MTRVLSGVQPSGEMHLGNYLGAFRSWVADQDRHDAFYCVVDLHSLTLDYDRDTLRNRTLDTVANLLAVGLDPARCTIFVQSHVPEHPRLSWLLECTASMGELRRMTQFKEKATRGRADGAEDDHEATASARVGLFTYPVLMAADILLYDADRVPVGEDQRQHLELTRDLALRFNHRYGPTFTVPEAALPPAGARVMDLQEPTRKMSKSVSSPQGTVLIQDAPDVLRKKIRRAVTDTETEVRYDRSAKPGVSNLLELLAAATGGDPVSLAGDFDSYGKLKDAVADALIELLGPVQARYAEVSADPSELRRVLAVGARRAGEVASATYARAADRAGLLAP